MSEDRRRCASDNAHCCCCDTVPPLGWRHVHAKHATNNVHRVEHRLVQLRHTHKHYVAFMEEHFISSWLLDYLLVEFYCACVVRCSAFLPRIAYVGSIMVITSTINGRCIFTASLFASQSYLSGTKRNVLQCISVATPTYVKFRIKTAFTSADCHARRANHGRLGFVPVHGIVEHVRNTWQRLGPIEFLP